MKNRIAMLCVGAAMLCSGAAASAAVLFDNGPYTVGYPQAFRNYDSPGLRIFEDFILGADAKLQTLEWTGGEYHHTNVSKATSADIVIYQGAAPGVGAPVYAYSGAITANFSGSHLSTDRFNYTLTGLDVDLDAGTHYWIGLSLALTSGQANWGNTPGTASTIGGLYHDTGDALPGTFYANENAAFRLVGELNVAQVPLPGTLALVGLGLAGVGLVRRRTTAA